MGVKEEADECGIFNPEIHGQLPWLDRHVYTREFTASQQSEGISSDTCHDPDASKDWQRSALCSG